MIKLTDLLREEENKDEKFEEFAQKRHDGAEKIANDAKKKGGPATLTYNHFVVKLPYYRKANQGKMDLEKATKEYNELVDKLKKGSKGVDHTMVEFQKLVGRIEVLGELIIKGRKK